MRFPPFSISRMAKIIGHRRNTLATRFIPQPLHLDRSVAPSDMRCDIVATGQLWWRLPHNPQIPHRNRLTTHIRHPNVNVSYIHMRPSMTSAANQDAYGSRGWNQGPWGNTQGPQWQQPQQRPPTRGNQGGATAWAGPPFWHPAGLSRPAAIAFTVLGFIFWWPVGLALLIYMIGSGRMGCFGRRRAAMYQRRRTGRRAVGQLEVLGLRAE